MGWRVTSLLAGATLTGASGCMTPYGAALSCRPGADGYCQRELAPGRYALTYAGTPEDSGQPLAALWLARAAQLCGTRSHEWQYTHGPAFDVRYQHPALTGVAPDMALADAGPAVYGEVACTDTPVAVAAAPAGGPAVARAPDASAVADAGTPDGRSVNQTLAVAPVSAAATGAVPAAFGRAQRAEGMDPAVAVNAPAVQFAAATPDAASLPGAFVATAGTPAPHLPVEPVQPTPGAAMAQAPVPRATPAPAPVLKIAAVADAAALPPSARGYVFGPLTPPPDGPGAGAAVAMADVAPSPAAPAAAPGAPVQVAFTPASPAAEMATPAPSSVQAVTSTPPTGRAAVGAAPAPFQVVAQASPAVDATRSPSVMPPTAPAPAMPVAMPVVKHASPPAARVTADAVPAPFQIAAPAQPAPQAAPPVSDVPVRLASAPAGEPAPVRVPDAANLPASARGYVFGPLDGGAIDAPAQVLPVRNQPSAFQSDRDALLPVRSPAAIPDATPGVPFSFRPI